MEVNTRYVINVICKYMQTLLVWETKSGVLSWCCKDFFHGAQTQSSSSLSQVMWQKLWKSVASQYASVTQLFCNQASSHNIASPSNFGNIWVCTGTAALFVLLLHNCTQRGVHTHDEASTWHINPFAGILTFVHQWDPQIWNAWGEISKQLEGRGKSCTSSGAENGRVSLVIWIAAGSGNRNLSWTRVQDTCRYPIDVGAGTPRPEPEQTERKNKSYLLSWQSRWQGLPHSLFGNKFFLVWISWGSSEEERRPVCQEHSFHKRGSSRGQDSPKAGFNRGLWIWLWF